MLSRAINSSKSDERTPDFFFLLPFRCSSSFAITKSDIAFPALAMSPVFWTAFLIIVKAAFAAASSARILKSP
tara:strand:- start:894 stop:1112 length:219 start_codon:yes stop_codon:yes gene_type:complete